VAVAGFVCAATADPWGSASATARVQMSHGEGRGIVRITPEGTASVVLSGMGLVGLALLPTHRAVLTTTNALFSIDWDVDGLPLAR